MKYYTIGETSAELGINRTTLERRYKRLKIRPKQGDIDKREWYLSEKDIEQLRTRYAAKEQRRKNAAQLPQNNKAAMLAEIQKLRERVETLEQDVIRKTHISPFRRSRDDDTEESHITPLSQDTPSDLPRSASQGYSRSRDNRRTTITPDMPDHLIGLVRLCTAHGVAPTTANKQWRDHHLFDLAPNEFDNKWKIGRVSGAYGVDRDNALKALRYWLAHGEMDAATIGHCGIEQCPCSELVQNSER